MTKFQLEALTLRIAKDVVEGRPVEDSTVELKREWPDDSHKAARRIGGHANEARGTPIVWLIGLDEKSRQVSSASGVDLDSWHRGVAKHFDGVAPHLILSLAVPYDGQTVYAITFGTDRFPYVVNSKDGQGTFQKEVPFREGTGARSARREDLLLLLEPTAVSPDVELIEGHISLELMLDEVPTWERAPYRPFLAGILKVFLTPREGTASVLPLHRAQLHLKIVEESALLVLKPTFGVQVGSQTITPSGDDVLVKGPGRLEVRFSTFIDDATANIVPDCEQIEAVFKFHTARSAIPVEERVIFVAEGPDDENDILAYFTARV